MKKSVGDYLPEGHIIEYPSTLNVSFVIMMIQSQSSYIITTNLQLIFK